MIWQKLMYIRFGEIPENERSKIYRDDEILKELPKYKKIYNL